MLWACYVSEASSVRSRVWRIMQRCSAVPHGRLQPASDRTTGDPSGKPEFQELNLRKLDMVRRYGCELDPALQSHWSQSPPVAPSCAEATRHLFAIKLRRARGKIETHHPPVLRHYPLLFLVQTVFMLRPDPRGCWQRHAERKNTNNDLHSAQMFGSRMHTAKA